MYDQDRRSGDRRQEDRRTGERNLENDRRKSENRSLSAQSQNSAPPTLDT